MKKITVLLAEDHLIVREGFRGLLKGERDIEIVGEAENGRQAVQLAKKLRPAVVVMDIAMPQLNGLEATRQILEANPATKVIMLSAHADDAYVQQATAAGAVAPALNHRVSVTIGDGRAESRPLRTGRMDVHTGRAGRMRGVDADPRRGVRRMAGMVSAPKSVLPPLVRT